MKAVNLLKKPSKTIKTPKKLKINKSKSKTPDIFNNHQFQVPNFIKKFHSFGPLSQKNTPPKVQLPLILEITKLNRVLVSNNKIILIVSHPNLGLIVIKGDLQNGKPQIIIETEKTSELKEIMKKTKKKLSVVVRKQK
jgi:hypothetical protein